MTYSLTLGRGYRGTVVVMAAACWLAVSGCSDDGVTPAATTGAATGGATGEGDPATGSVNTSATVTASGEDDAGSDGPTFDVPPAGTTTSGPGDSSGDDGPLGDSSGGGSGTGGPPEPECVEPQECECADDFIVCDAEPPECPPDFTPLVDEGCWEGSCVPIESCFSVEDCTWCDEDEACVAAVLMTGPQYTCQPIPRECERGMPTCECMPDACEEPFFECAEPAMGSDQDITCFCPTC